MSVARKAVAQGPLPHKSVTWIAYLVLRAADHPGRTRSRAPRDDIGTRPPGLETRPKVNSRTGEGPLDIVCQTNHLADEVITDGDETGVP